LHEGKKAGNRGLGIVAVLPLQLFPCPVLQVAADVDVLYQTRIQKERFQDRWVAGGSYN
jgi:hypothetical protein